MARGDPMMRIRIPEDLKCWLKSQASRNLRTQNSEIVLALREKAERTAAEQRPGKASSAVASNETALQGGPITHG